MEITFSVEEITDPGTGQKLQALVKTTKEFGKEPVKEPWGTIIEFDKLFDACSKKWGTNWDLDKVITVIQESEIR